jgi:hypothetical protein
LLLERRQRWGSPDTFKLGIANFAFADLGDLSELGRVRPYGDVDRGDLVTMRTAHK